MNVRSRAAEPLALKALLGAALAWALVRALDRAWTCDDAFIVFRYARNLAEGLGLVFNAGERVEGYTDFLWVLWTAPAFVLGISPELWTNFWSIACYLATIVLLGWNCLWFGPSPARGAWPLPVAALAAAAHPDWNIYATSGLETSAFTFFLVAGFVVLSGGVSERRAAAAGALFGLASLTRPDGLLPAVVAGAFVFFFSSKRAQSLACFGSGLFVTYAPLVVFRRVYYHAWLPNTYYAKSASVAWYEQGLRYLSLYSEKYGAVLLGLPFAAAVFLWLRRSKRIEDRERAAALWPSFVLAAGLAVSYTFYVVRIGGDFMYARMLIPATPFFLVLFELALAALGTALPAAVLAPIGLLPVLTPLLLVRPVDGRVLRYGVGDEWAYYSPKKTLETDHRALLLRSYLAGLPVRMLAFGSEMRLVYRAEIPLVVEAHGLTDPVIAHLPLQERGRPGHEKLGSLDYLVGERKLHLMFHESSFPRYHFERFLPVVPVEFGRVRGLLLHWDPTLMAALAKRGVRFEDFPAALDRYLGSLAGRSDAVVAADYARIRRFYFDHVADPARERPFRARLGLP